MSASVQLYRGREEAPVDDQLYDFSRQRKQADLLELNCGLLEKKLLLCNVKTMQAKCLSTFLAVVISGAKDIFTLPSSTSLVYVKVKCGEAVFHTHPFEKDATDWASAPMEITWNEVPADKILSVSVVDQAGEELAKKEIEVDLDVGHGFDRWVTLEGSACLRLQIEHKGVPSPTALGDLEADIADLVSRRRHLKASIQSGLPPMSYATYTTMVAEVERRLCDEVERLRAVVEGRGVAAGQDTGLLRVYETGRSGPVSTYIEDPGVHGIHGAVGTAESDGSPVVQSLLATLTGRNRVIRQLQDTLAGIEAGEPRNVSETILLLASQLEERETTLAQLKADLPPLSLSALVIDQSNVINTLLSQLHKAIGSLVTANQCVEKLTGQAALYGGDIILQELEPPVDPIMTPPQIAALLTRYDEQVQRVRELEALVAEYESAASGRESKVLGLHAEMQEIGDHAKDVGVSVVRLCEQFNDSLNKLADISVFLAGESGDARISQMPAPIEVPSAGTSLLHLANTLDTLQAKLADAHLLIYDEVKGTLPQVERLRFIRGGEVRDQQWRKMELKLLARDMDFDDLLADHEALLVALATARQQLAAPLLVPRYPSESDQIILDACDILLDLVPEVNRAVYLVLPPQQRLLALLRDGVGGYHIGLPAVRITPLELRGLNAESPYIVARFGNAVQQTPTVGPSGRWNSPMTFALDGPSRNLEINVHDRTRSHPLGHTTIHVDQFPHGVPSWVALDDGGDVRLQLDKCRLNGPAGQSSHSPAGNLDGIAKKLENTIDVLSRGTAHVLRPSHVTPSYLHKLADLLWDLAHGGATPVVRPPSHLGSPGHGSASHGDDGGLNITVLSGGVDSHGAGGHLDQPALPAPGSPGLGVDPTLDSNINAFLTMDPNSATLQFLMRSRAGLIRRIWACLQICKVCNSLSAKHHSLFSQNKGHRMEVGQFKAALEDLSRLLGEVGSLEDGLAWIVGNYFTDTEKRDLGTSPHLYPAQDRVVKALPGLIESTDIMEARRISPGRRRPPAPGSPYNRRDFLKRLQDAHITVLDSKDGAMDGRYFGHDLRAVQHLDGEIHDIGRRRLY